MGKKRGEGGVTVREDDDDGAVRYFSVDGTTLRYGVTTCGMFNFLGFAVSSGVLVVSWHLLRLAFFLRVLCFFFVMPFLFSKNADTLSF